MSEGILSAAQKWRDVLDRFDASGLSAAAFCRRYDIPASSFFTWKRKLGSSSMTAAFIEARVSYAPPKAAPAAGSVEVCLRGGRRLRVRRGFDLVLLAEVVAAKEGIAASEAMS